MRGEGWLWAGCQVCLLALWIACTDTTPSPELLDARRTSDCQPMTCASQELDCGIALDGGGARVTVPLTQGQTVLVVVDGMAHPDQDTPIRYTLHVSEAAATEAERCADGADNDADGMADAADSDCL